MQIELTESGAQNDSGYIRPRGADGTLLLEAENLMQAAWHGTSISARARLQEAMAVSDFRNAAFEIIDRETLERYQGLPAVWSSYARQILVRDFKPKAIVDLVAGMGALPNVPELTEYPERKTSKSGYSIQVSKKGARFAFSWESWINDELDELESLPEALAIAARETESRTVASLLTDGDGPNAAFFNATAIQGSVSNLMAGNPALTSTSLQDALIQITTRKDVDGRPIAFPAMRLVVPPGLDIQARAIVNATQIEFQEGADGDGQRRLMGANWLRNVVEIVVDPWLTVLDTSANASSTWYLVPAPNVGRPAFALGKLRGHEEPQVRVKAASGNAVGGGATDPSDGSFEIDDIQYRVRHVLGSSYIDPIGTLVSTGAGS